MSFLIELLLVTLLLLNMFVLGSTRIRAVIQAVALQGTLLGLLPLLTEHAFTTRLAVMIIATIALKGIVLPRMLLRAMRDLAIRREIEPLISIPLSLVLGAAGTGFALLSARWLPMIEGHRDTLMVPASLATVFSGFLLLTTRQKAITQVLGYLVLDNGVYIFGLLLIESMPFLVEVGVLLDLFVGIFVMGIIINHINREFSSVDTDELTALRD